MTQNRRLRHLPILLIALAGCGSSQPASSGPLAPHGGTMIPLSGGKGFAEFVKQDVEGKAEQVQYLVYFLGPDSRPLGSSPTAGQLKSVVRGSRPIDLKPAGEPEGAALATPPMPDPGEFDGELSTTLDGSPATIRIKVR